MQQFIQRGSGDSFVNDIALLKLAKPVKATPITISDSAAGKGDAVRLLGWGNTCTGQDEVDKGDACYPKNLREVDTQVQAPSFCGSEDPDGLYCVGSAGAEKGAENMDSGGPMIQKNSQGHWELLGATRSGGLSIQGERITYYQQLDLQKTWIEGFVSGKVPVPDDSPLPSDKLAGTVRIGGCAGSVFKAGSSRPGDAAMILTNGHCVDPQIPIGKAVSEQKVEENVFIYDKNGWPIARAKAVELVYGTMTGTDIAVYRLDQTYAQLAASGVSPRSLATSEMRPGQKVDIISGPSSQSWLCTVEAIIPELREGGYTQRNSVRYSKQSGCQAPDNAPTHGDSGSPIVDPSTGMIVGVHNTGNDGDGQQCTENNPCEIGKNGKPSSVTDAKYGQQVIGLNECLIAGSKIDLNRQGCALTGSTQVTPAKPVLSVAKTTIKPGEVQTLTGSEFTPGSKIGLVLYSTPVSLGEVQADEKGQFEKTFTIPDSVEAGSHLVTATGENGEQAEISFAVTKAQAGNTSGNATGPESKTSSELGGGRNSLENLAATGAGTEIWILGGLGTATLIIGTLTLVLTERRRKASVV